MSDEMMIYGGIDSWANMLAPAVELSKLIAGTELVNRGMRGKPASVCGAILTGRELNIEPMTALRSLHVIEGQVSLSADLMTALIFKAGHKIDWIQYDDKAAEVRITRGDGLGEATARFTMQDAERANLAGKPNWRRYPRSMLRARALHECAVLVAADCLYGLGTADVPDDSSQAAAGATTLQAVPEPEVIPLPVIVDDNPAGEYATGAAHTVEYSAQTGEEIMQPVEPVLMISPEERSRINALLNTIQSNEDRRMSNRERLTMILSLAGADASYTSALQLTSAQAQTAIDSLQALIESGAGAR